MPKSMWSGNYGEKEAGRRARYDRNSTSNYRSNANRQKQQNAPVLAGTKRRKK